MIFSLLVLVSLNASAAGKLVSISPSRQAQPGDIVVHFKERTLDFILDETHAIRYPVAVPKSGMEWSGTARVDGKYWQPAWAPPAIVKRDHPELPDYIEGGAPNNPMGMAALTLDRDQLAIHGTTKQMRSSIGTSASYGCIRMYNEDITDLFQRVETGAVVFMVR